MTETTSEHLRPFLDAIGALAAIPDPTERARAFGAVLDAVPDLQRQLREGRQGAFAELSERMKNSQISELLGISEPRVSQILKGVSRTSKPKRAAQ